MAGRTSPAGAVLLGIVVTVGPALVALYIDHRLSEIPQIVDDMRPAGEPSGAEAGILPRNVVMGETVYVPLYAYVYHGEGDRLSLAATLSLRNTDPTHEITITRIEFYDTRGTLVHSYLKQPLRIKPMGSTDVLIKESDSRGGVGANFLVDWVADVPVTEPVIEAVMVGRTVDGACAFARPGIVMRKISSHDAQAHNSADSEADQPNAEEPTADE